MKTPLRLFCAIALACSLGSALTAQTVYVATGSNGVAGSLYTFDVATEQQLSSVPITNASGGGAIGITGLAFNPLTGVLYGVTSRATNVDGNTVSASLVTVNITSGVATVIGSFGANQAIGDIAFASNGVLYGWEARSPFSLATISLTNGAITTVGVSGLANTTGGGLAISPVATADGRPAGTLYLSATGASPTPAPTPTGGGRATLDIVNPATGAVTRGVYLSGAPNDFGGPAFDNGTINALAFDNSGVLFGSNSDQLANAGVDLITINLVTGAITDLFLLPVNTDAIAFVPIPEPSTIGLLITAVAGAGAVHWYRKRRRR